VDFARILARRRMVRGYGPAPVPPDVLDRVLSVVAHAPSAGHCQPHRLVAVTNPAVRARLTAAVGAEYASVGLAAWMAAAPVHVGLGIREASYHERYRRPDKLRPDGTEIEWAVPYWWFDAGALFQLLHLAAINEGLVAGFYYSARPEAQAELRAVLELPDDVALAGVMTLGHPPTDPERSGQRDRIPWHEHVVLLD